MTGRHLHSILSRTSDISPPMVRHRHRPHERTRAPCPAMPQWLRRPESGRGCVASAFRLFLSQPEASRFHGGAQRSCCTHVRRLTDTLIRANDDHQRCVTTAAVGYMCFAPNLWMTSMANAAWYDMAYPYGSASLLPLAILLGVMGIFAYLHGRSLDAVVFFGGTGLLSSAHAAVLAAAARLATPESTSYAGSEQAGMRRRSDVRNTFRKAASLLVAVAARYSSALMSRVVPCRPYRVSSTCIGPIRMRSKQDRAVICLLFC